MKFKPLIGAELSGSIGGITASHNLGGAYFRSRVVPVNPASPEQALVRQIFGNLAALWTNTVTASQRAGWADYAANVTILDALGESINITALNMYIRSNTPRIQNGLPRVDAAPVIFNLGDFTAPTIISMTSPSVLSLGFDVTDAWVSEDDAAMLVYGSRNTGVAINFFKGPYRKYPIQLLGNNAMPPTSPHAGTNPFNLSAGNKSFLKVSVTRADGRLSQTQRLEAITI